MKTTNHKCYPVFETNQILTSTHLNRMREYLDEENRLTRNKLIGFGIVCGLKVHLESKGHIIISKGNGVTTDGYLLALDKTTEYTRYKSYSFPTEDEIRIPTLKKSAQLIEILPEDTTAAGTSPLTDFETIDIKDKVVALFLEFTHEILQSCTGTNCDNKGKKKNCTVKVLLVNKDDFTGESSFLEALNQKYDLPDLFINRFALFPNIKDVKKFEELVEKIDSSEYIVKSYQNIFTKNLIKQIAAALSSTYKIYQPFLETDFVDNPFISIDLQLSKIIEDSSLDVQYRYDFLSELIKAYNEFKDRAFNLVMTCAPDIEHFPQHLLLGIVDYKALCKPAQYRYPFIQPPIYNDMAERISEVKHLFKRLLSMIANFYIPAISKNGIKITPSKEKLRPISEWSIPFYYFGKKEDSKINEVWNYAFYPQCRASKILSYFSDTYNKNEKDNFIRTPLEFNHDEYPFMRIEAIHGKKVDVVMEEIVRQSKIFHLPFKTVVLNLEKDTDNVKIDYDKVFYDLQEEYFFHRRKLTAIINDVKKYYEKLIAHDEKLLDEIEKSYEKIEDDLMFRERVKVIFEFLDNFSKLFPPCLKNFDYEFFKAEYKKALGSSIDFILIRQKLLENIFYELKVSKYEKELAIGNTLLNFFMKLIFKLIDSLYHTQLLRIYFGFKRREYFLLINHLSIFSNFVKKHPGIEHLSGVYKGGTFILVCEGNEVIADFSLPYLCCTEEYNISLCDDPDTLKNIKITPFARPDFVVTTKDKRVSIDVLDNDDGFYGSDVEFVKIIHKPKNGEVKSSEDKDEIIYFPEKGFTGVDTFTYLIRNIHNKLTDEGVITVIVLDEPLKAVDDYAETTSGKPVVIEVMNNDAYPVNTKLKFVDTDAESLITSFKNTFVIKEDDTKQFLIFKSKDTFVGEDQCRYKIVRGERSDEATVRVKVNPVEVTIAAVDDTFEINCNTPTNLNVLENDSFNKEKTVVLEFYGVVPKQGILNTSSVPMITTEKGADVFLVTQQTGMPFFKYVPYSPGSDRFAYQIKQGNLVANAAIKIDTIPAKDPVASVTGTITAYGIPLYACNVLFKGTGFRTRSDDNGMYEIKLDTDLRGKSLIFYSDNYGPKEVIICSSKIDIDLSNYPGSSISNIITDTEDIINRIKVTEDYKIIITNPDVATNVDNTIKFTDMIKTRASSITEDINTGKVNTDLTIGFTKVVDPLIKEIQIYNKNAAAGSITNDDTLKYNLNIELFNTNVETFLNTISTVESDIDKSGEIANFIATDLKKRVDLLKEIPQAKTEELINKIATANSNKPELAAVLLALNK